MRTTYLLATLAFATLLCACAKEQPQGEEQQQPLNITKTVIVGQQLPPDNAPIPKDSRYAIELFENMIQVKLYLDQYISQNHTYPTDLRELKYPGMKVEILQIMEDQDTKRDFIRGYFKNINLEDTIYVQYEKNSFGKEDNPMITVSYGANFPKNRGYMQLKNGIITCVAATGIAPANEACKALHPIKERIGPIRAYYYVTTDISDEAQIQMLQRINDLETQERAAVMADIQRQRKERQAAMLQEQEESRPQE